MTNPDAPDASQGRSDAAAAKVRKAILPRGRRPVLIGSVVLAVVVGVALAGWFFVRPPQISVVTLAPGRVELALSVVGRVRPGDLIDVRSPNPGQVIQLLHDDGDIVAVGAPLAVVRALVQQAQTDMGTARERAAGAEVTRAQLAFNRTRTLSNRGFASQAALDEARAVLSSAQAGLAAAAADRRASAALTGEFTIRAPIAGAVLVRPIDNGQVVSPQTTLFQLGSLDGGEIQAEVDEAYADGLRVGMPARAALSGSEIQFPARVIEVSPRVDPLTGGRLVKLAPDARQNFPSGRSVDVTIVVSQRANGIVVPRQAILDATTEPKVYVVDDGGVVRTRPVRIAAWPSLNAIIDAGLIAGDRVVLTPAETSPSARVRPIERAAASPPGSGR